MKLSILCFIIAITSIHGQEKVDLNTLIVDYSHSLHIEGMPSTTVVNAKLIANQFQSLYEMDFLNQANFVDEEDGENETFLNIKTTKNPKIYKDSKTESIYSVEYIFMNPFYVKDDFKTFNWKLTNEFKTILGYKSQKVTLKYRGRNYIAFFTTEIPFNGGPWKFMGLPGFILEIKSIDGAFEIAAEKIEIKKLPLHIENPYERKSDNFITWNDFISKYKKKYEELQSYTAPGGGSMSIPKRKIEVLIED